MNFSARALFLSHLRTRARMFGSAEDPRGYLETPGFQGRRSPIVLEAFAPCLSREFAPKGFFMWACGEADIWQGARIRHLYCWLSEIPFLEDGLWHKRGRYHCWLLRRKGENCCSFGEQGKFVPSDGNNSSRLSSAHSTHTLSMTIEQKELFTKGKGQGGSLPAVIFHLIPLFSTSLCKTWLDKLIINKPVFACVQASVITDPQRLCWSMEGLPWHILLLEEQMGVQTESAPSPQEPFLVWRA